MILGPFFIDADYHNNICPRIKILTTQYKKKHNKKATSKKLGFDLIVISLVLLTLLPLNFFTFILTSLKVLHFSHLQSFEFTKSSNHNRLAVLSLVQLSPSLFLHIFNYFHLFSPNLTHFPHLHLFSSMFTYFTHFIYFLLLSPILTYVHLPSPILT